MTKPSSFASDNPSFQSPPATPQDVAEGYLRPLQADNWDRASLLNFRAFSIPPAYDYSRLATPVLLVQVRACTGAGMWAAGTGTAWWFWVWT